ncbi:hypothetical protein OMP44_15735 [Pseudomonas sp. CBMAI 2609]|uniref:Uncharacterized protein n=1 Tax=Pseudomonas flavocrustae TaxID=2991719 RepID=A0ABT6IKH8_9PSED|nr:hypothetical protein [Pseudomonas sp. CBMAI 2609]MDH4764340.1 hypothetical protein [Pseudomonas sp. CBMAI 2609]
MDKLESVGAVWHLLHLVSLDKPPQGKPCNGCGLCCIAEVFDLGKELGDEEQCRALMPLRAGRFARGLVTDPYRFLSPDRLAPWRAIDQLAPGAQGEEALKSHFAGLLGTGRGCDADDEAIRAFQVEADANRQLPLM